MCENGKLSAMWLAEMGLMKDGKLTAFAIDCYGTGGFAGGATVNLGLFPYVYLDAVPNIKRNHSAIKVNAGMAQAMLLDRLAPGWQGRIMDERESLETVLAAATANPSP